MVVPRSQPTTKRPRSKSPKATPMVVVPSLLRRFVCHYPGCSNKRGFSRSADLKRHQDTHNRSDAKTYDCTECPFTALQKSNLKEHLLKHKPGTHFDCPSCEKSYRSSSTLTRHVQQKHNVVVKHTKEYYLVRGLPLPAHALARRSTTTRKNLKKREIRKADSPPSRSASVYAASDSSSSSWETFSSSPASPGFGTLVLGADPVADLTKATTAMSLAPSLPQSAPAVFDAVFDFGNVNANENANAFTEQYWDDKVFEEFRAANGIPPAQTGAVYDNSASTNFSGDFAAMQLGVSQQQQEYDFRTLDLQGPFMGNPTAANTNASLNMNVNVDYQTWAQQPNPQVQQYPQQNQQQVAVSPFDAASYYFQMGNEQAPVYDEYNNNDNFQFDYNFNYNAPQVPQAQYAPSLMPSGLEMQHVMQQGYAAGGFFAGL